MEPLESRVLKLEARLQQLVTNASEHRRLDKRLDEVEEGVRSQKFALWRLETEAKKEVERLHALEAAVYKRGVDFNG